MESIAVANGGEEAKPGVTGETWPDGKKVDKQSRPDLDSSPCPAQAGAIRDYHVVVTLVDAICNLDCTYWEPLKPD